MVEGWLSRFQIGMSLDKNQNERDPPASSFEKRPAGLKWEERRFFQERITLPTTAAVAAHAAAAAHAAIAAHHAAAAHAAGSTHVNPPFFFLRTFLPSDSLRASL